MARKGIMSMTVAEMIKQTRLEHNMTQNEYADQFGVTRQTVSSWENGKSLPDLQMLITICNTYHLSLDALLNDNRAYVSQIDVMQKIMRISKKVLPILGILLSLYLIFFGYWKVTDARESKAYASRVAELGFQLENGHYEKEEGQVIYSLPNQKLSFLKFHFFAQYIDAQSQDELHGYAIRMYDDEGKYDFTIDFAFDRSISGSISSNHQVEYDHIPKDAEPMLEQSQEGIEKTLLTMASYYKVAYELP